MTIGIRISVLGCCLFVAAGCSETSVGTGHPPLGRADVENIEEGDAQGSDFSGRYTITSFDVTRCDCREGSDAFDCSTFELAAEGIAIEQDEGLLEAQAIVDGDIVPDIRFGGGVDSDGSFQMGSVLEATNEFGDPIGTTFQLVEGELDGASALAALWMTRLEAVLDGTSIDCDVDYEIEGNRID
jgi:hypothetical protein